MTGRRSRGTLRRRLLALAATLVLSTGRAFAHAGHGHGGGEVRWVPAAAFLASVGLLAGAVYADRREGIAPRVSDAAVIAGLVGVLLSIGLLFF